MRIVFIAVGDELLKGETIEINGNRAAQVLGEIGLTLNRTAIVSDTMDALAKEVLHSTTEPALCIISGGLGPTDDDCTRLAVAKIVGSPLVRNEDIVKHLRARAEKRGREFSEVNLRQADIPEGATTLPNEFGTAPGFLVHHGQNVLVCLPGVPFEFQGMLRAHQDTILGAAGISVNPTQEVTFRIFGITESRLQEKLSAIEGYSHVKIRSLPHFPEIRLKISPRDAFPGFEQFLQDVRAMLSWCLFSESAEVDFFEDAIERLHRAGATLALAESCTGGLIAHRITRVPDCSRVFQGGVVSYANEAKSTLLDVPAELIAKNGAVSEPVARAMALGAQERLQATHAIAVTGIAGPSGGTAEKPVGTVYLAVAHPKGVEVIRHTLAGFDRKRFQILVGYVAVSTLCRELEDDD